jgi:glutathione S-transferase
MQLYYHPLSTFSRRVRIQLLEKGQKIEEISVDMAKREHKGEAYRALNPYARVPALVERGVVLGSGQVGDFVLFESSAIMDYLESVFPTPALLPSDARGRALVNMHVKLCDLQLASQTEALIFPRRFLPRERWDLPAQQRALDAVTRHLDVLEQQLAGRQYLVAERYSLAEVAYTPLVHFLPLLELTPPANVAAWIERISQRPSALATQPAS